MWEFYFGLKCDASWEGVRVLDEILAELTQIMTFSPASHLSVFALVTGIVFQNVVQTCRHDCVVLCLNSSFSVENQI